MASTRGRLLSLVFSFLLASGAGPAAARAEAPRPAAPDRATLAPPVAFEPNVGQTNPRVRFVARAGGYTVFVTGEGPVIAVGRDTVRMRWAGGSPSPDTVALDALPGRASYFSGADPSAWRTGVPTYGRVRYRGVYDGVDVDLYGSGRELEYDVRLAPGADPSQVRVRFEGARSVRVDEDGALVLALSGGELRQPRAVVYQEGASGREPVAARYAVTGDGEVGFDLGAYDRSRPLVVDPVLVFSATFGGMTGEFDVDTANDVAVGPDGSVYAVGYTESTVFPTTDEAYDRTNAGFFDAVVLRFAADGSTLLYSTFLGGDSNDFAWAVEVDASGAACVAGATFDGDAVDFPTTPGAFDETANGGNDGFLAKLAPDGASLVFSTFVGGPGTDQARALALDAHGAAYVAGQSEGGGFPTTPGAYDETANGGYDVTIAKLSADGASLVYATYVGGDGVDEAHGADVDASGALVVAGVTRDGFAAAYPTTAGAFDATRDGPSDAFATRLAPDGASLTYSTLVGGGGEDFAYDVAVDAASAAYVTGYTTSADFPATPGAYDATLAGDSDLFAAKIEAGGSALVYATYVGGGSIDQGRGVAVGVDGTAFVTGYSLASAAAYPTTPDAHDGSYNGGGDAVVTRLSADGSALLYSTYLGGAGTDRGEAIALAPGVAAVAGHTSSFDFAGGTFGNRDGSDGFVAKLRFEVAASGADTVGVHVASSGAWFLRNANSGGAADIVFGYGPSNLGWIPLRGDWNGDGVDTVGLYDPASGFFFLRDAHGGGGADAVFGFGAGGVGLVPIVGDWDGDGDDTIGLYAPGTGAFFLSNQNASGGADLVFTFGAGGAGFVPLAGDWDGDGDDTVGLYDPSSGFFFLRNETSGGPADEVFGFGAGGVGLVPLAGDWDGDGDDTVGLYVTVAGAFFLTNANAPGPADLVFGYGPAGATPLAGDWDGL